ncbi:MAG: hypothetical protein U1E53_04795 [Dongiaceae bacterium]
MACDDRANPEPFAGERRRRRALLEAAVAAGAGWVLALDPAERIEDGLGPQLDRLLAAEGLVAYAFRLRSMMSPTAYRTDDAWGVRRARRLFSIRPGFAYDRSGPLDHWYPSDCAYRILAEEIDLYDFRTATPERRRLLRAVRMHLDPFLGQRPLTHEFLTDETGMTTRPIAPDRPCRPAFVEDGGLWSSSPAAPWPPSRDALVARERARFAESIRMVLEDPASPLRGRVLPGHARGADRLDRAGLVRALQQTCNRFAIRQGYAPDLFRPRRYLEKLVWRKFFANLPVPQSGNKLLVASFIPPHLAGQVQAAPIVWQSRSPALPANEAIAAGWYYLKSNHGSGNVLRVRYPLEPAERTRLERTAEEWLRTPYPPQSFEWWYDAFPRALLLERSVTADERACTWSYPAFPDGVPYVNVNRKTRRGVQAIRLTPSLDPLPERHQPRDYERLPDWETHFDAAAAARIAREIAAPLGFARIDLLFGPDGACFLNEVTLTPNNAEAYLHPELDERLGALWTNLA